MVTPLGIAVSARKRLRIFFYEIVMRTSFEFFGFRGVAHRGFIVERFPRFEQ